MNQSVKGCEDNSNSAHETWLFSHVRVRVSIEMVASDGAASPFKFWTGPGVKGSSIDGIQHRVVAVNGINMHIAEKGTGPVVLLVHGFPSLWYSWRHQIQFLASSGYRVIAPDMRGYGATDAPNSFQNYTTDRVVGDLVALIDSLGIGEDKVYLVGHDVGSDNAWNLCLYRPDKVKAFVALSVPFNPRIPAMPPIERFRKIYGDDYYMIRFQEPGVMEAEIARYGTANLFRRFFTARDPRPFLIPKDKGLGPVPVTPVSLPSWMSEEDISYYASQFDNKSFTGGLNYYRAIDLNWELTTAWNGAQVKVPSKFIAGDLDRIYNSPGAKEYIHGGGLKKFVPFLDEVVVMKGVGHWIMEEEADKINTRLYDFFHKF